MNNEECILCGAPLEYFDNPIEMVCAICHRKFTNNGEFTVAFATAETMIASDFVGIVSAKNDSEKMAKTGLAIRLSLSSRN